MSQDIIKRNKTYHFRMRVPARYRHIEGVPREIKRSLKTDSASEAELRAAVVKREELAKLDTLLAGQRPDQERTHFHAISELAASRGYSYQTATDLAAGPTEELVRRLLRLARESPKAKDGALIAADLGGVEHPRTYISELVGEYEQARRNALSGKTEDQKRTWRNPLKRAVSDLLQVVPDKPISDLTRTDALRLEALYSDRVEEEEILSDTANKRIGALRTMLRHYTKRMQIEPINVFHELSVEGGRARKKRPEFSSEWIRDTLFCENPLPGTNDEIRDVLIIMAVTGAGPSEITGALPQHFLLDHDIPHIALREEGRKLKNEHRVRELVLIGPALDAARRHPNGFERYRGKPGFSDTANKYLTENNLLPSPEHSAYCLRHSFQGRMRRAKTVDEFYQARMMGHSAKRALDREVYGDDLTLLERLEVTELIRLDR